MNAVLFRFCVLAVAGWIHRGQQNVNEAANNTSKSIKVILHFSEREYERVQNVLKALAIAGRRDIVLIDARGDNKPSGSNA